MERVWKSIDTAPYQKIVWVRNKCMVRPIKATRGFSRDGVVHSDQSFFTSVFTNERYLPMAPGKLVCPTEWTECPDEEADFSCMADAIWDKATATQNQIEERSDEVDTPG